jgi:hypothetical protein
MVPEEDLPSKRGFTSVYGFDAKTAGFFKDAGTTKGAKHFPVYSERLWMDFDNADAECEVVVNTAIERGLRVEVYDTGNRGYHVCLFHQPVFDKRLPYSQKAWIKDQKFNVDFCLYQAGHLLRLNGTRHEKTGRIKSLTFSQPGDIFELPLLDEPVRERRISDTNGDFSISDFSNMLVWFTRNPPKNGERNHKCFSLAAGLLAAGVSVGAMTELVTLMNIELPDPIDDEELSRTLSSAVSTIGV